MTHNFPTALPNLSHANRPPFVIFNHGTPPPLHPIPPHPLAPRMTSGGQQAIPLSIPPPPICRPTPIVNGLMPSNNRHFQSRNLNQAIPTIVKTSVPPPFINYPPPPLPMKIVKDELALRQEEFIKRCMYPTRKAETPPEKSSLFRGLENKREDSRDQSRSHSGSPVRNNRRQLARKRSNSPRLEKGSRERNREQSNELRSADRSPIPMSRNRSRSPQRNQRRNQDSLSVNQEEKIKRISTLLRRFNPSYYDQNL